ncbi:hypothetical protein ACVCNR_00815 [Aquamicrobium terrae]
MLTRIALRIAAVEALKGATLVGNNVLDSEIGAIDIAADGSVRTDADKPFIAAYTDASKVEVDLAGRALQKSGPLDMVLEYGVTAAMTVTDEETGESTVMAGIPATDAGLEFTLDLIGYQISAALADPDNEWADIWRSIAGNVQKIERKRTADAAGGTRVAAQQMTITVDLMADPIKGETLRSTATMTKFFARALSSPDPVLVKKAQAMQAALAGADPDWKLDMRRYGLTDDEACKMQIKPVEGAPETISEVIIR